VPWVILRAGFIPQVSGSVQDRRGGAEHQLAVCHADTSSRACFAYRSTQVWLISVGCCPFNTANRNASTLR
jgi:hypothetical protein